MCDSATRPAFIPVPNVAKVTMKYQLNLQEVENVFHFQNDDAVTKGYLDDLTNAVLQAWQDNIMPLQPSDLELKKIEAVDLTVADSVFDVAVVNQFGSAAGASMPGNVTLSIKFDGGFVGRSQRGRMYWLQLKEADVVGDLVQTAPLAAILNGVADFFGDIQTALVGTAHVVVSYCHNGEWRSEGQATPITDYSSDGIVDSQRRRLTGRGR